MPSLTYEQSGQVFRCFSNRFSETVEELDLPGFYDEYDREIIEDAFYAGTEDAHDYLKGPLELDGSEDEEFDIEDLLTDEDEFQIKIIGHIAAIDLEIFTPEYFRGMREEG